MRNKMNISLNNSVIGTCFDFAPDFEQPEEQLCSFVIFVFLYNYLDLLMHKLNANIYAVNCMAIAA